MEIYIQTNSSLNQISRPLFFGKQGSFFFKKKGIVREKSPLLAILFKTYNNQNKKLCHNSGKPQLKRILI